MVLHPFRKVYPRRLLNKPPADVPDPSGWHHTHGVDPLVKRDEATTKRRKLLCHQRIRTKHWSAASWRLSPTGIWTHSMNYSLPTSSIIARFPDKTLAGKATYRVPPRSTPPSQTSATSSNIRQPMAKRW